MTIYQWLFVSAVVVVDLLVLWWICKNWIFAPSKVVQSTPCAKCATAGIDRESEFVKEGQWLCSAHYNEVLLDEEKMLEESRRQHRDAILDGGLWTQRLLRRQERLSEISRKARR